jgi:voltage-gated sodium channel
MSENEMLARLAADPAKRRRHALASRIESPRFQRFVVAVIVLNAVVLGMETSAALMASIGPALVWIDRLCLAVFTLELSAKIYAYRSLFWRNGWNLFDAFVVALALAPGTGTWSVLRSLRVLRVLRLLTVVPQLRRVVAAFLHAIPGLAGVLLVMVIFFYTAAVVATNLFATTHPQWFGSIGASLYSLFQVMTLESWSMGIARPLMEQHPWAWVFFVPFIVVATFTILNLFIGIIVSTMQELGSLPEREGPGEETHRILARIETDLAALRTKLERRDG